VSDLAERTCVPCRGGVPPLTQQEYTPLLEQLGEGWRVLERPHGERSVRYLEKTYRYKNFTEALNAAVAIGAMADEQNHHPDLHVAWGALGVEVWTHKIGGLTESDFIFAAKCDAIA
jgi:4a-hydroxytetrahydrobiopterin dehydratase